MKRRQFQGIIICCLVALGFSICTRGGDKHWSLQPIVRPGIPTTEEIEGGSAIDHFLLKKLREKGLSYSPEADARTVVRRLYFNIIGLAPTPEEVAEFEQDPSRKAYQALVEKLLASPHYGERWGRHWLDVVRFAETHGYEMNQPRPNAWPYRDYVIRSFNEDKPYDIFLKEQVAGDVLGVDEATGFLVAGPWDQVKSPDPVLTANQRADELHDMVSTMGSAFLGLTVGCARCHDHKFDPISQREYFALKAVFEGVQHGERKLRSPEEEEREKKLAKARERLEEVERRLEAFQPVAKTENFEEGARRAAVHPRMNIERVRPTEVKKVRFTITKTTDAEPCIDELEVYATGKGSQNVALASAGTKARASSVYPNSEIHRLEHINDGKVGNGRSWISNERGMGWVELEFPESIEIEKIVWGRDREQKYADRLATEYKIEGALEQADWKLLACSKDRQGYDPGRKDGAVFPLDHLSAEQRKTARALVAERESLDQQVKELGRAALVYAGSFQGEPEPTHRFHRGDPMLKREAVEPGGLEAIPAIFPCPCENTDADLTEDQRRRLALGYWLGDQANPLPARVMVNRIWQYHFGEGLVSTPSDLGVNGARPTHPELLDWLAAELIEHNWSLKHVHRLILNSVAYRQTSAANSKGLAADSGSRLLWRFPPRRLEAEVVRDLVLQVSGKLDRRMGGTGFSFFEPNDNYVRVYTPRSEWSEESFRRMIYGTVVRQRPDGVFGVFDCPDAGQIAPKRNRSTTPLQALNLLNSTFIMQQAEFFAGRLGAECGEVPEKQARRAFSLALQREPDEQELAAAAELIRSGGLRIFCRAMFNANEFIYLF